MDPKMESKDKPSKEQNEDKLSKTIGEFGKWQIYLYFIIILPLKMCATWTLLDIVFLAPKTTFRCQLRLNSSEEIVNSTCYSDCVSYEYFTEFENTIISQWDLICDRAWLANLSQTSCMFGALIGSMIFGFISDRYGRRVALLISCMLHLAANIVTPFAPVYWSFALLRFILGASAVNIMVISFVIYVELVGPRKRELINTIHHMPLALGEAVMPAFSYYLRSWSKFSMGVAVPNFIFLTYFFIMPESPKWLISMNRLEEASEVMKKAAKCNGLPTENMLEIAESIAKTAKEESDQTYLKVSYKDLVMKQNLRMKNLCSCVCWFNLGLGFYGSNQYIGQTSSNVFLTVALAGLLQVPGILLSYYLLKWAGRRKTLIGFYLVSALSNGLLVLPDDTYYVKLIAGSVGISSAGAAFASMYIYTTELFPTVARNMAMGASSTAARIGSMLAPFIAGLHVQAYWVPAAIFGVAPLIAAGSCFCLPETRGKKLSDHI